MLTNGKCRLLFERVPLPKTRTRTFFILRDDRCSMSYSFWNHHSNKLQFNLPAKRLYIIAFLLLDYILATANEHSLPGFDKILFVWSLEFDFHGMDDPIKRFYL